VIANGETLPEPRRVELLRAAAGAPVVRSRVLSALHADEPRERQLAVRACAARGWLDAPRWQEALSDDDPGVRREAAELLASGGPDELTAALIDASRDDDPLVAEAAAMTLGARGDRTALDELMRVATSHDDARCREAAVVALGEIGDERALPVVIGALDDKAPVRRRAVVALAAFEGEDAERALARALEDRDWQVRAAAETLERDD
jgi:HEAT repeat protein